MDVPNKPLEDSGERLLTSWAHVSVAEHLHRYAVALSLADGKQALDIASGEGYGSALLGARARRVLGIDRSAAAAAHAAQKYATPTVSFAQGDATCIPCPTASFDLVVSFETIEHLLDQDRMLSEIRRVLRPDGVLVMSSPERANHGDKDGYVNEYHVRELYGAEFLALISRHFPHVTHLQQQVLSCSALWPAAAREECPEVYTGNFSGFTVLRTLRKPAFHVVLAGNAPVAAPPASLFDGTDWAEAYLQRQATEIANLNTYVAALRAELASRGADPSGPAKPELLGLLLRKCVHVAGSRLLTALRQRV